MTYAAWWVPFLTGWLSHWLWTRSPRSVVTGPRLADLPVGTVAEVNGLGEVVRIVDPPPYDWADE